MQPEKSFSITQILVINVSAQTFKKAFHGGILNKRIVTEIIFEKEWKLVSRIIRYILMLLSFFKNNCY